MRGRFVTGLVMLGACLLMAAGASAAPKVYGKGISAADTVLVSHLLAHPDDYIGKVVRVEGTAVATCPHRGCWINLASDGEGEVVRVKVDDGTIVFPPEIVGELVVAEGVWTGNKLDLETSRQVCAHQAKEEGKEFDPNDMTTCITLYQVTATGAVVLARPQLEEAASQEAAKTLREQAAADKVEKSE
jgi:hypothetical protein